MTIQVPPNQIVLWATSNHGPPQTFLEYTQKSREILSALRPIHRTFERFVAVSPRKCSHLSDESQLTSQLMQELCFDSGHLEDYEHLSEDGRLTDHTLSRIGFEVTYCLVGQDGESIRSADKSGLDLSLKSRSSGREPLAHAVLGISLERVHEFREPAMMRRLLGLLIDKWELTLGGITIPSFQQLIRGPNRASYAGQWLYYLPFPNLGKCLPADIRHEPFANGILIETTPHMPDADNPADVAAGKRVRDVLDELGLVNDATYAIEGWPQDEQETLYEQFISGAPAGRKYTVHCVNFDGYDPDRKVLLYAKLFRRLKRHPKEHGLRGWDGPVLNEAKRQVRAAAKAGGVPIEWHIGLEEPALQVRQLLADHTTITEQQLRVIYTPMEQMFRNE